MGVKIILNKGTLYMLYTVVSMCPFLPTQGTSRATMHYFYGFRFLMFFTTIFLISIYSYNT